MSQAFWERLASPEVFFLLLVSASFFTVISLKAFFYEPRAILCVVLGSGILALLYRYGYHQIVMAGGVLGIAAIFALLVYYVIRERRSRVLRGLLAGMVVSALLAMLLVWLF